MSRNLLALATAVAFASPMQAHAAKPSPTFVHEPAFIGRLDPLLHSLEQDFGHFGMAIAVIERGQIVGEHYFGLADIAKRVPMSRSSLVNVASVSKSVSAMGVLRLADQGRISLDEPVFDHITRWQLPKSEFSVKGVTAARLLSHTAGISRHTTGTWTVRDRLPTLEAALSGDNGGYGDTRLIYEPGTKWSYSGGGYSILQLLAEEVTRKPFTDYMNSEVLPALRIQSSGYGWDPKVVKHSVTYYDEFEKPVDAYRTVELAAGGFNSTARDLAQFAMVFSKVGGRAARPPLSSALMQRMTTPAPAATMTPNSKYGLGVMLEHTPDGRTLITHDGGNPGSGAFFAIDPRTGNGIAILVNRSWANDVSLPVACEWRNATALAGATPETCKRYLPAILEHTLATKGIDAGKAQYDQIISQTPDRLGEQQMVTIADRLSYSKRYTDALAVVRWHLARDPSSTDALNDLGQILSALSDRTGARSAWESSLRIKPGQTDVIEALKELDKQQGK